MMPCRVIRRHLDALADGELDTTIQVEFESHLATCPICREHAAFTRTIKRAVKHELGGAKAPERLRLRVLTALESAPAPQARPAPGRVAARPVRRRRGLRVWMLPARYAVPAAAAAALVVVLGARSDDADSESATVAAATVPLFDDVARRHAASHPPEVQGQPQQVARWFDGKLPFPARPVTFEGAQARFVGARLSNVRERDAAAFYYDVGGHRVTVMVFEPPRLGLRGGAPLFTTPEPQQRWAGARRVNVRGRDVYYRDVHGYTVPVVEQNGLTYAFTGDLDSQSMLRLAATAHVAH
jgi:anti-sigma factor (TIGR02949 family)